MTAQNQAVAKSDKARSLVVKMAEKYGVDPEKFMSTLKSTAFKQRDGSAPSNEQMMALMVVSDQYGLNPFTKEIYAFPDKNNGIVPVVGVDGWSRIINTHRHFDGVEFRYSDNMVQMQGALSKAPEWIEAILYRKDRSRPVIVREYLDECYKPPGKFPGPWQTHPKRFLRHKSLIQGARIGFGFVGIYDQDEAENIIGSTIDGVSGAVVSGAPRAPVQELTDEKFDELMLLVTNRAKEDGAWSSAYGYIEERFSSNPGLLEKARQRIAEIELEATAPAQSGKAVEEPPEMGEQPPVEEYANEQAEAEEAAEDQAQGSLDMG